MISKIKKVCAFPERAPKRGSATRSGFFYLFLFFETAKQNVENFCSDPEGQEGQTLRP